MSYVSNRKLTNVIGRLDYISNEERQENIVEFYNSQDLDFWKKLAKENREQFKITSHAKRNRKPVEAREFIGALPQSIKTDGLAKKLCDYFYQKYGVYCACSIHKKALRDENGNIIKDENGKTIYNLHFHLIYAERELLPQPLIVEERIAPRTYYYDAQGKKCKKAEAVKTVPKGTVLQKGYTRYFDNKKDFYSMPFVKEYKEDLENLLNLSKFDPSRHFPTKHIGKNNPKSELFSEYNELISELNYYFDQVEGEYNLGGMTPKQKFCEMIGENKLYIPQIDDIKEFMEKFKKEYPLFEKTAQNANKDLSEATPEKLIADYREINSDISTYFDSFECAAHQLETYAVWEENGRKDWVYKKDPIFETYGFEKPRQDINALIEKYSQKAKSYPNYNANRYKKIQPQSTMKVAFEIAKELLKNLIDLLETISQKFLDLTGQKIEPVVKSLEQEEKSRDEEEYEYW